MSVRFESKADIEASTGECPLYPQYRTSCVTERCLSSFQNKDWRRRKMLSVPTALNNSSEYLPNSGGQSHCQCPPKRHPNHRAKNICAARSCSDCTEKRKKP